jgi:hypothetical protein
MVLLRKADLTDVDPGEGTDRQPITRVKRLQRVFDGVRGREDDRDRRRLQQLVIEFLNDAAADPSRLPVWLDTLKERLLADEFELRRTITGPPGLSPPYDFLPPGITKASYQLLPAGAAPAPTAPEITALEAALDDCGYQVAKSHYGQAVRSYVAGDLEAANGQLRSFLEDLFVELARGHGGYSGDEPVAALQALRNQRQLLDGEFNLLRGLWELSQSRGPHRGLSTAGEALFRLQTTTSTALFVLRHVADGA